MLSFFFGEYLMTNEETNIKKVGLTPKNLAKEEEYNAFLKKARRIKKEINSEK